MPKSKAKKKPVKKLPKKPAKRTPAERFLAKSHIDLSLVNLETTRVDTAIGEMSLAQAVTEALAGAPKVDEDVSAAVKVWLVHAIKGRTVSKAALQNAYRAGLRAFRRRVQPRKLLVVDGPLDDVLDAVIEANRVKAEKRRASLRKSKRA